MKTNLILLLVITLAACGQKETTERTQEQITSEEVTIASGTVEVVAELDINPGNVAVSSEGRVFMSVHPMRPNDLQLVEVTGNNEYSAFPDQSYQSPKDSVLEDKFDALLGVIVDNKDRLWVIDAGLNLGKSRLFCFDVNTGEKLFQFNIPTDFAPKTSFVQDVAVDEINEWVYLADFGDPGIIAIDIEANEYHKFRDSTMVSEDIDIRIDGEVLHMNGSPARVGINPITLSADRETVYYGAMTGTKWYKIPTKLFRDAASDEVIQAAITIEGAKPISDGATTDNQGNHYFTNIQDGAIDVLTSEGELKTLVKSNKMQWPDNIRHANDGWLYVAVNQLNKAPAFSGGEDGAKLPYYILKVRP